MNENESGDKSSQVKTRNNQFSWRSSMATCFFVKPWRPELCLNRAFTLGIFSPGPLIWDKASLRELICRFLFSDSQTRILSAYRKPIKCYNSVTRSLAFNFSYTNVFQWQKSQELIFNSFQVGDSKLRKLWIFRSKSKPTCHQESRHSKHARRNKSYQQM